MCTWHTTTSTGFALFATLVFEAASLCWNVLCCVVLARYQARHSRSVDQHDLDNSAHEFNPLQLKNDPDTMFLLEGLSFLGTTLTTESLKRDVPAVPAEAVAAAAAVVAAAAGLALPEPCVSTNTGSGGSAKVSEMWRNVVVGETTEPSSEQGFMVPAVGGEVDQLGTPVVEEDQSSTASTVSPAGSTYPGIAWEACNAVYSFEGSLRQCVDNSGREPGTSECLAGDNDPTSEDAFGVGGEAESVPWGHEATASSSMCVTAAVVVEGEEAESMASGDQTSAASTIGVTAAAAAPTAAMDAWEEEELEVDTSNGDQCYRARCDKLHSRCLC